MRNRQHLIVIGNGMVGHRLLEQLIERDLQAEWAITTFCEEPRPAYDRVQLSAFFGGRTADELSLLPSPFYYRDHGLQVRIGERVTAIDRQARTVLSSTGDILPYDRLVLATGSLPFVPRISGNEAAGCFVYRTIEDLERIRAHAAACTTGVVIGGGLLGLEAAHALQQLNLTTHVVEFSPRLMSVQVDEGGGAILRRRIEARGVHIRTSASTTEILTDGSGGTGGGRVTGMQFADKTALATQMIVFSAGIRPRDELAKDCGLAMGERGGVAVDERCRTSDPDISAIGEVAAYKNRIYGLVAPGYRMATVVADDLSDAQPATATRFTGFDMSTKLKLLGVEVASFGDAFAVTPGSQALYYGDAAAQTYKKLVVSNGGRFLLGGILVGDASSYGQLLQLVQNQIPLPPHPEDLILPARSGASGAASLRTCDLPDTATICSCHNVTKGTIVSAISERPCGTVDAIKSCTRAGTGCGSCTSLLKDILTAMSWRAPG